MATTQQIKRLADSVGLELYSYSGRGMYGDTCLAVNTDDPINTVLEIVHAAVNDDSLSRDDVNGILEDLGNAKTDSMGLGKVVYWEHLRA